MLKDLKNFLSPTKYLSLVNVVNAGLGAILGIINARLLGPDALGVVGVVAGVNATLVNVFDIRLMDVLGKLYYSSTAQSDEDKKVHRSSVVLTFIVGSGILGLLIGAVGYTVGRFTIGYFTDVPVKNAWLAASAYYYAVNYLSGAFVYQQRFSERFYLMGTWRLLAQIVSLVLFLEIILNDRTLDGYYAGSVVSTTVQFLVSVGLSVFIWKRHQGFPLASPRFAWRDYWREIRLVLWGNILGYVKLLHRGSDILLVGFFADDRVTGLYKVARSVTDIIYVLYDALNQVYYPRFMQLLSERSYQEYRHLSWRLMANSGLFVLGLLGLEAVGLSLLVRLVLTSRFAGAETAILILTLPVFFVLGLFTWFWPVFVFHGRLGRFTLASGLAVGVQYLIAVVAFKVLDVTPALAALGYLGYYLILAPAALVLAYRVDSAAVPLSQMLSFFRRKG